MMKTALLLKPMIIVVFLVIQWLTPVPSAVAFNWFGNSSKKPGYWEVSNVRGLHRAISKLGSRGGTIRLRPGTYILTETLHFERIHHLNIIGSGWNTVIKKKGAGDAIVFRDCSFCVVRDLLLDGEFEAEHGSGIVFEGQSSSCTIDFCRISWFPESGIRYNGVPESPQSSNTVRACHLIGNRGDQIRSFANNDFYIMENQFGTHRGMPQTGAYLEKSSAGTYTANYHWGNIVALQIAGGCNFNRIENNRFEESAQQGILIGRPEPGWGTCFNIITGNTIHTNSKGNFGEFNAVEAYDAHQVTFCTNQILSWDNSSTRHKSALVVGKGCWNWIIKDNNLRHSTAQALVYDETAAHIVKDNLTD